MTEDEEIEFLEKQNEELRESVLELRKEKEELSASLPSGTSSYNTNVAIGYNATVNNGNVIIGNTATYTSNIHCPYIIP